MYLSTGYLSVLATWHLAFPRIDDPEEQDRSHNIFYGLFLKSYCLFSVSYYLLSAQLKVGWNYTNP